MVTPLHALAADNESKHQSQHHKPENEQRRQPHNQIHERFLRGRDGRKLVKERKQKSCLFGDEAYSFLSLRFRVKLSISPSGCLAIRTIEIAFCTMALGRWDGGARL
jgi:hypothetical protein